MPEFSWSRRPLKSRVEYIKHVISWYHWTQPSLCLNFIQFSVLSMSRLCIPVLNLLRSLKMSVPALTSTICNRHMTMSGTRWAAIHLRLTATVVLCANQKNNNIFYFNTLPIHRRMLQWIKIIIVVVLCSRKTGWSHNEMVACNLQLDRAHDWFLRLHIVGNGAHILLYCRLIAFLDTIEGERFNFILRQSNKYVMEFPSQGAIIN